MGGTLTRFHSHGLDFQIHPVSLDPPDRCLQDAFVVRCIGADRDAGHHGIPMRILPIHLCDCEPELGAQAGEQRQQPASFFLEGTAAGNSQFQNAGRYAHRGIFAQETPAVKVAWV
jgi:hypothetical protein